MSFCLRNTWWNFRGFYNLEELLIPTGPAVKCVLKQAGNGSVLWMLSEQVWKLGLGVILQAENI